MSNTEPRVEVLKQAALTLLAQFGAPSSARIDKLEQLSGGLFKRPATGQQQGPIAMLASGSVNLLLTPANWIFASIAGEALDFAALVDFYTQAVAAGLAQENIASNVQLAYETPSAGIRDRLFGLLPWAPAAGTELVGSGTRYVFKIDEVTLDFNTESDFSRPDSLILVCRMGIDTGAFADVLARTQRGYEELVSRHTQVLERLLG